MREFHLTRKILAMIHVEHPTAWAYKTVGGPYARRGVPDILACIGGRFFAFEVKLPGGKATALQRAELALIYGAGGGAYVVTSVAEVRALIARA